MDFPIPDFTVACGLNFSLPDIPYPLDYFVSDELWDLIETNHYVCQRLSNSRKGLADFLTVTHAEIKAFIGINRIMGFTKLPQVALHFVI